uniref:Preprotein translocase subunit SecY n=1 Tax=Nitzschia alba TaxID=2858 RepID=A0A5C0F503_NITAL|nr:preprotein translocase subunit SecY [Nitzschia alba]QEI59615.1 preprotein translocase subunit SecY [Nitzschia alba]
MKKKYQQIKALSIRQIFKIGIQFTKQQVYNKVQLYRNKYTKKKLKKSLKLLRKKPFLKKLFKKATFTMVTLIIVQKGSRILLPYVEIKFIEIAGFKNVSNLNFFSFKLIPLKISDGIIASVCFFNPDVKKLKKNNDYKICERFRVLSRQLCLGISLFHGSILALSLRKFIPNYNFKLFLQIVFWFTSGDMSLIWLSELNTKYGIGNGQNIISLYFIYPSVEKLLKSILNSNINSLVYYSITGISISVVTIYVTQKTHKIELISVKESMQTGLHKGLKLTFPIFSNIVGLMPTTISLTILESVRTKTLKLKYFYIIIFVCYTFCIYISALINYFFILDFLDLKDIYSQFQKTNTTIPNCETEAEILLYFKRFIFHKSIYDAAALLNVNLLSLVLKFYLKIENDKVIDPFSIMFLIYQLKELRRNLREIYYWDMSHYDN